MKHSTTLVALVTLILAIAWGCSGKSDTVTPGGTNTTTAGTPTTTTAGTPTSTTTAGSSTTGGGLTCIAPQVDCGGACANTQSDTANCGVCGHACTTGQACNAGTCGCAGGGTDCSGTCVDITTDADNCGACGTVCGVGAVCQGSTCVCQTGLTDCTGACVNTMEDVNNCGVCGTQCGAQVCSVGVCSDTCATGLENCTGSCVNTMTSPANCGSCSNACDAGLSCAAGMCECPTGQLDCGTGCVDTQTSATNCGACGTMCPATATCTTGMCACPSGQELCGAACVATGTCEASACAKPNSLMISDFEGDPTTTALMVTGDAGQFNGLWEGFNDETSAQQFDVETVTDAECGTQALHTSGSGFSEWGVGIGFSFKGEPAAPTVYDASAWTGIRFKAKKGSGGLTPVRFNISIPKSEGIPSGGTCDDTVEGNDCYNHPGRFLEGSYEVGADWRTYHLCFDRDLYPQFLPSTLTNAERTTVSSNVLKFQFIFNRAIDPSKDVEEDPNGGLYDLGGAFDFWVDDMELTNDPCPETLFESTGTKPFPQNKKPGSCELAPNVAAYNTAISEYYEEWKARYVQSDGGVFSPEDSRVISEGMGYGLLLAAAMGDKAGFDQMWGYVSSRLEGGLMKWTDSGTGSATDADADIAYALIVAGDQWGGDYASRGSTMVSDMGQDVSGDHINPGSNWAGKTAFNPSYSTPAYYAAFGGNWASTILNSGYSILDKCEDNFMAANDNGLVPDWCDSGSGAKLNGQQTAQVTSTLCDSTCDHYAFDAARVPWRVGVDACLNDRSQAKTYLGQLIGHFVDLYTAERIDLMRSGYRSSDGMAHGESQAMQASFIGPVGVGAMSTNPVAYQRALRTVLDILRDGRFNRTYYPSTVGLISLLEMTGNIPHH